MNENPVALFLVPSSFEHLRCSLSPDWRLICTNRSPGSQRTHARILIPHDWLDSGQSCRRDLFARRW